MSKELLLYGALHGENITGLIKGFDEAKGDVSLRLSSNGGSPEDTWGVIAKMKEFGHNILIKVDGRAHSTAAFFLAYATEAEGLDVSEFMLHRAAYPKYYESDESFMTEAVRANLERINASLRAALEAKIDVARFEKITGVTMDELFSMDGRVEVFLTAKQAKQIGLIDRINQITPEKRAEIDGYGARIAAEYKPKEDQKPDKDTKMDIKELKEKHPELFAQVRAEGVTAGIEQEKDRAGAWLEFADVDLPTVQAGIKGDKDLSKTQMVELTRKSIAAEAAKGAEVDSPEAEKTKTEEAPNKTAAEAEKAKIEADFRAELNSHLGIDKKG